MIKYMENITMNNLELLNLISDKVEDLPIYKKSDGDEPKVELFEVINIIDDLINQIQKESN